MAQIDNPFDPFLKAAEIPANPRDANQRAIVSDPELQSGSTRIEVVELADERDPTLLDLYLSASYEAQSSGFPSG